MAISLQQHEQQRVDNTCKQYFPERSSNAHPCPSSSMHCVSLVSTSASSLVLVVI